MRLRCVLCLARTAQARPFLPFPAFSFLCCGRKLSLSCVAAVAVAVAVAMYGTFFDTGARRASRRHGGVHLEGRHVRAGAHRGRHAAGIHNRSSFFLRMTGTYIC